jgi:hypothetical protein
VGVGEVPLASARVAPSQHLDGAGAALPVVDRAVDRMLGREPVVGMAVAVIADGVITELAGYGWSSLQPRRPFTPDTVSRACSLTKIVTAVAVLQLAERGLLDLDAPASAYLGSLQLLAPDGSACPPRSGRYSSTPPGSAAPTDCATTTGRSRPTRNATQTAYGQKPAPAPGATAATATPCSPNCSPTYPASPTPTT